MHQVLFQIHFWIGALVGAYLALMSVTGSLIVYRNELPQWISIEWVVNLHANLLAGSHGRFLNGIGGVCLTSLCLTGIIIWWPGVRNWRRSLTVSLGANFPRMSWDLHSAMGFWFFPFILMWAISGVYFAFPQAFAVPALLVDPSDNYADRILFALSELHFGRFSWFTRVVWSVVGLVLAALAFTGTFICCRRLIFKKPSNPFR